VLRHDGTTHAREGVVVTGGGGGRAWAPVRFSLAGVSGRAALRSFPWRLAAAGPAPKETLAAAPKEARMNRFTLASLFLSVAAGHALAGVNYALVVGVDYAPAGQRWAVDATNVTAALAGNAGWNAANITTIAAAAGPGAAQVNSARIAAAIAAIRPNLNAGDGFLFYYSGHGSYFMDGANPEVLAPAGRALDRADESLFFTMGDQMGDDALTASLATLPAGVNKLAFIDSCFSGGFWGGSDAGDLDRVAGMSMISASDELRTAPGSSDITNNWRAWLGGNGFDLSTRNAVQLRAMFNAIKPGGVANPQQKMDYPPGFSAGYDPLIDPFPGAPWHPDTAQFFTNVPAPGALALLGIGFAATRRRRPR
jgi:MYXO-CTERM domain-containing protein